jgi:hypothetical protein
MFQACIGLHHPRESTHRVQQGHGSRVKISQGFGYHDNVDLGRSDVSSVWANGSVDGSAQVRIVFPPEISRKA